MRREWINEEKPNYRRHDDNSKNGPMADTNVTSVNTTTSTNNDITNDAPLDDELEDLFAEIPGRCTTQNLDATTRSKDDAPPDDDLDMLLAEAENINPAPKNSASNEPSNEGAPPDDDLDMLLAEVENTNSAPKQIAFIDSTTNAPVKETNNDNDAPPDDDLDMLLAEAEEIAQAGDGDRRPVGLDQERVCWSMEDNKS